MRSFLSILALCFLCSCNNEKVIQLPEITHSEVNEILDVSPAYLFYDESKPDSLELNRKNLIGSTNWLVNVDRRLTLDQAIPTIIFLQEKKRNKKMHKNEAAKNYFTCNNTSIQNLGFIEFTDVNYIIDINSYENDSSLKKDIKYITISFFDGVVSISEIYDLKEIRNETFIDTLLEDELIKLKEDSKQTRIDLMFQFKLTFQDYISAKSEILRIESESISINDDEFLF